MAALIILLYLSLFFIFWAYFGYPFSLKIIQLFRSHPTIQGNDFYPKITLIITAYNEEKRIKDKLENTISLTYPKDKLQIIVVSDGSTDKTHNIVKKYARYGIELYVTNKRRGKEFAQKEALQLAKGDIIVFSDTATILDKDGLQKIVQPFADSSIGCVSSEDFFITQDGTLSGEGVYVKYEMWLRKLESSVNSVVGLSGSFFAARKEVLKDFSGEMQSDFRTLLNSQRLALRGVSNPEAKGYYKNIADESKEFNRKVRTVLRGITVYFKHLELLNPFKYGLFSYQYFSHKLLRWLVPWFMIIAFISNLLLIVSVFSKDVFNLSGVEGYFSFFIFHFSFYLLALLGKLNKKLGKKILFKIPYYFVQVNYAIFVAWIKYIRGERVVMWQPSER